MAITRRAVVPGLKDRVDDAARPRTITILGSTGSIGTQTIELLGDRSRYQVKALVGGKNAALLADQALALGAELAVIADPDFYPVLKERLADSGIASACGPDAVVAAAALEADWTMAAITGAAGLPPTLEAIKHGRSVALANKEALVCAGDVMLRAVEQAGATLLPVDSEHNAIFQALADGNITRLDKIVLTASGGPFRTASLEEMKAATPERALKHPVWSMGAKISIDSATMMNKGLEVIEAARLFSLTEDRISVLVHPQSVVHGLVYYQDGSVLAQLGSPDMRIPIAHTLAWPERVETQARRLDLAAVSRLDFEEPDVVRFPALRLAREVLRAGGGAPAIYSAANEIAVDAFLNKRIGFLDIAETVDKTLQHLGAPAVETLETVFAVDAEARRVAASLTQSCAA
ncbi:1-deoxy-D-xylulose 5-phosphate reductoisomerase [Granulibacter bethesdensis CGDNIH1]|uniref:1-deoxy-D-xylulose 5-phosphate reductoisomerase n=1 Tax=Granulibacter bethesdensis (strain ATCC BAA-1260 / CGDNIH1) TaxID=391165 RepID=Q0BTL6_GRABC|nr:1-deoxy-D-xylulose 5-phosphate reductoisomerase [Granulibacter bethesdensis CGDNIH1]APH51648.1 1-deoxy-D-xylulose 5-phosphate reductoisomerase [Granulibacter bethesdensis]APH64341.1 1-deoxy-D-xylulose 5-phosphate reductoisomerase [Granulibacter bethesdensis]